MNDDDIDADATLTADEKTLIKQQREKLRQFMTRDAWKALEAIDVLSRTLDLTLRELAAEDWRKLLAAGKESFTQALGRAVADSGGSGLPARSAAVRRGGKRGDFPRSQPRRPAGGVGGGQTGEIGP